MAGASNEIHRAGAHGPIFVVDDNADFRDALLVVSAHDTIAPAQGYARVLGTLTKPFPIPELLSVVNANC